MALILANPFGEVRGKLGANVFSRNGSGAYARSFSLPINPNTVAQSLAREKFTNASKTYRALSGVTKAKWNEYAQNHFVSRTGSHSNKYSGYQAYMSLSTCARVAEDAWRLAYYQFDGAYPVDDLCFTAFTGSIGVPPLKGKISDCVDVDGKIWGLNLKDVWMDDNGKIKFTLNLAGTSDSKEFSKFEDSHGNRNGFVVYCSNPTYTSNMFFKSPLKYTLGYFKPWHVCDVPTENVTFNEINYESSSTLDISRFNSFPYEGEWVRISVYSVSNYGALSLVGSKEVYVQPA